MSGPREHQSASCPSRRRRRRRDGLRSRKPRVGLGFVEGLEHRQLPALIGLMPAVAPVPEVEPNNTLDVAQALGAFGDAPSGMVIARGAIGGGVDAGADVDWYSFTLDRPALVSLASGPAGGVGRFQGVVGLYNNDLFDFGDPLNPLAHRLIAQVQAVAPGRAAELDLPLTAGTYFVAVSGAGNRDFHPLMAESGLPGVTGDYDLMLSASGLDLAEGGPVVIAAEPAGGSALDAAPLAVRLSLSAEFDPSTLLAGQSVRLIYHPTGHFGDGAGTDVPLASVNFGTSARELQLFPLAPLAPGAYRVVLAGDATLAGGNPVVAALDGTPLGADAAHPTGRDFVLDFDVNGVEEGATADDSRATAHDLGDVTNAGVIRVVGVIGDDPYHDPSDPDPTRMPGNDVNMYRFTVSGPGRFALRAEAFAGRIGSPLDPGLSLFRVDPADGSLRFVAGNNNTLDTAQATDGSNPLQFDSALFAGLTAGEYVIAVAAGFNTPSPLEGQPLDMPGLFDPNVSHSGTNGFSVGPYVLCLRVESQGNPPWVVAATPHDTEVLDTPPDRLTVRFSAPVNLQMLAYAAYQQSADAAIAPAYVVSADGTTYFTRLESYDPATNSATFLMLDGLPNGSYAFHLSGRAGLTDLGGNPLVGNTVDGDHVVRFTVDAPPRGVDGDPLRRVVEGDPSSQDLGMLFPHELQAGVTVTRPALDPTFVFGSAAGDAYRFEVLQAQNYGFSLVASGLPAGTTLWLTDAAGEPVPFGQAGDAGTAIRATLVPGSYTLHVGGWSPEAAAGVEYRLLWQLTGQFDFPPPLVSGPSPALRLRLDSQPMPPAFGPVVPVAANPPSNTEGGVGPNRPENPGTPGASALPVFGSSAGARGSSSDLVALAAGPVGEVKGAAGRSTLASSAVARLETGQGSATFGQSLVQLLTLIEGFDVGDESLPFDDGPTGPAAVFGVAMRQAAEAELPAVEPLDLATTDAEALAVAESTPAVASADEPSSLAVEALTDLETEPGSEPGSESEPVRAVSRAELGWAAGLVAIGALTLAYLRRLRAARSSASARVETRKEDDPTPGKPIGLGRLADQARGLGRRRGRRPVSNERAS